MHTYSDSIRIKSDNMCGTYPYPDALQADLVAHGVAQTLGTLLRHSLTHGDGRDTTRLGTDDVGHLLRRPT